MSSIGRHAESTSVTSWGERHGVIPEFLPLDKRSTNSLELVAEASAAIDELSETASCFKVGEVIPEARGFTATILRALGSWPYPGEQSQQLWVNPNYLHRDALGSVVDEQTSRMDVIERCARLGVLDMNDVLPRLDATESSVFQWLGRRDVCWRDLRREGKHRFARTLFTAMDWGYNQREVASIWLVPSDNVQTLIHRYARTTDFEPPADPTTDEGDGGVWR